jgi:hypothetical protein
MKYLAPIVGFVILMGFLVPKVVLAGEPTGEIGPMNPTMFKCTDKDGFTLIQPDPFRKPLTRVFVRGGGTIYDLESIDEILAKNPTARESICTSETIYDFGFDTRDAVLFEGYLEQLKRECDEFPNSTLKPITDTRIEGFVYDFRPTDPQNPESTEWFGYPTKVNVIAKGITFEIFWGTDDNGAYYFNNLGAGPILLNVQLPPNAHMVNPNIFIDSTGLEETHKATLGFYRGDYRPQIGQLVTPDGVPLPFLGLGDIEDLSMCGYTDLPAVVSEYEPPSSLVTKEDLLKAIPDVGGVLPQEPATPTIVTAVIILLALPVAGVIHLRHKQPK